MTTDDISILARDCRLRCLLLASLIVSAFALLDKSAAAQTSQESQPFMTEGVRLLRRGQPEAAKQQFDQALALSPEAPDALTWRGIAENQLARYDEAISDFRHALKRNKDFLPAHYNLALALIHEHKTDDAIDELRVVVAAQPDAADPLYNLGLLLAAKGLRGEAAGAFARAHAARPGDAAIALRLLEARLAAEQPADLTPLLLELGATTTSPELQQQAGAALLAAGRYADAIPLLRTSQERTPEGSESNLLLARALIGAGQGDQAVTLMREFYRRDPADPERALNCARVLLATDHADEAGQLLLSLPEGPEQEAQREVLLGVALAATHKPSEAAVYLQRAIQADPSLSLASSVLGFCLFQQGEYHQASAAYAKASDLNPESKLYARDAAVAYDRSNQLDQALHYAQRANSSDGGASADRVLLGKLLLKAGRTEDAIAQLRRAAANPDLEAPCYLLARAYAQLGQHQEAAVWAARLSEVKQHHEAAFLQQKRANASSSSIRSSMLLEGGGLDGEQAPAP